MEALRPVEPNGLSAQAVYQIDGCLYRYTGTEAKGKNIKFRFQPLAGQRKQSCISLGRDKIFRQVMEVPSMYGRVSQEVSDETVQLNLF
ncbi:hypothetical protein [Nostoc sp.]